MTGFRWTAGQIIDAMRRRQYSVFDASKRGGYDLNLFGVRSATRVPDAFDDWIGAFYRDAAGVWCLFAFPGTTDPGAAALESPINGKGTAILAPGQHRGLWKLGQHQGKYRALVQAKPVGVMRDGNRDRVLDHGAALDIGMHGINLHRAGEARRSTVVGMWSAGCQVIADPCHFDILLSLCDRQVATLGYDSFTYTLLNEAELP